MVAAAGVGLAFPAPTGPVQSMLALLPGQQQHRQQAPHLGDGEGDQVAVIPLLPRSELRPVSPPNRHGPAGRA